MTIGKAKSIITEALSKASECPNTDYRTLLEELIEDCTSRLEARDFGDDGQEDDE